MDLNKEIGKRVAGIRKESKLSQEALGHCVGKTRTSIINIEKGRQTLTIPVLYELCVLFNKDPDYFLPSISEYTGEAKLSKDWVNLIGEQPEEIQAQLARTIAAMIKPK